MDDITTRPQAEITEPELTAAELEALDRDTHLADDEAAGPELYPRLTNVSAGFVYRAALRAERAHHTEYVTLPADTMAGDRAVVAVARWNMVWEAGPYRRRLFDHDDLPAAMAAIADRGDRDIVFVPRTPSRYHEYAPLFHLLPRTTVERYNLPLLRGGQWPFLAEIGRIDRFLPTDFAARLSRAWTSRIWRELWPQSPVTAFSRNDPVRLLAHNLDFWIPPVTTVIQDLLGGFPLIDKGVEERAVQLEDGSVLRGATMGNPRMGGEVWCGEQDADDVIERVLDQADAHGRLRAVIDAVRSHRVEDDFSERWSRTKEDFERKLHHKRSNVSVRFVELPDVVPVQGPETEVVGNLVQADFLALLDPVDRQIVVLLTSGATNLTEVATTLGYANHSAVSKRLAKIQCRAASFFEDL